MKKVIFRKIDRSEEAELVQSIKSYKCNDFISDLCRARAKLIYPHTIYVLDTFRNSNPHFNNYSNKQMRYLYRSNKICLNCWKYLIPLQWKKFIENNKITYELQPLPIGYTNHNQYFYHRYKK